MTQEEIAKRASRWLSPVFNSDTREKVTSLIMNDKEELYECFYKDLEFGTGGLRGKMGIGTNRINIYTIGIATQGLSNYLSLQYPDKPSRIAIAYDSRNNSSLYANKAAEILSANGHMVYIFNELRPTPLLSFAVRELQCQAGIVITASHNPKEYNGYKVYWSDGGQLVPPHDAGVIDQVRKIEGPEQVKMSANESLIKRLDDEVDKMYFQKIKDRLVNPNLTEQRKEVNIVFTSIHGTGITLIPQVLEQAGFPNVSTVSAQDAPDGNFPSVESPNPEEQAALALGLEQCESINADILLGTDPDADRVGIAIRDDHSGKMKLLNGNQAAALLLYYLLSKEKEAGTDMSKVFAAKTIVTSEILSDIAQHFGVKIYDTLTGFKYISELIKNKEGKERFIGGGEESYGYLVDDFVRDKDAVISSLMLCEMAAWAVANDKTIDGLLTDIYAITGLYKESLVSLVREGSKGTDEIQAMMKQLRHQSPKEINGSMVRQFMDYESGIKKFKPAGNLTMLDFPRSNVLQFITADQAKITIRPSGTEPKIKFYISVKSAIKEGDSIPDIEALLDKKIEAIKDQFEI